MAVRAKNKQKKLSNRVPETTTTQAVPSLSRARTCVARKFAYRSYDYSQFSFNGQLFNQRQRILPFRNVIARKNTKRREEKKKRKKTYVQKNNNIKIKKTF